MDRTGGDGKRIHETQDECADLVEKLDDILSDEQVFKPSHVKSTRAALMIFKVHLEQFDEFLRKVDSGAIHSSSKSVSLTGHQFHKARELLNAYDKTLAALKKLEELLMELKKQSGLSRFFSSISLRKRFDVTTAQLTESMQELLERQTETRQYEHRK